jgi:hypothetical protein
MKTITIQPNGFVGIHIQYVYCYRIIQNSIDSCIKALQGQKQVITMPLDRTYIAYG